MTVADQIRTSGNWSIFGAPSLKAAQAATPAPLQQASAEILLRNSGVNVPGPFADQQFAPPQPVAPNWNLYIGLGLGAAALLGLVLMRRRA